MRFKRGSSVEVLNNTEVPLGSWRPAKIVSGNGHTYYVMYDCCSPDSAGAVERVPRKAIRPHPTPVEDLVSCVAGDILEVFNNGAWKVAEVSSVIDEQDYFVRLLGSSKQFSVHSSILRFRQLWQDDGWAVIKKDSGACTGGKVKSRSKGRKFGNQLTQSCSQAHCSGRNYRSSGNHDCFQGPLRDLSGGMKRKASALPPSSRACGEVAKKLRVVAGDGRCHVLPGAHSSNLMDKVDAVVSPCTMQGENYMHTSLSVRGIKNVGYGYHHVKSPDPSGADSISSSVGSCSPSSSPYKIPFYPLAGQTKIICSNFDDAESSVSGRETSLSAKDALEAEIHLLELHAYRATILAFYASGPLSWERESLMSDLRVALNISTDEHLLELRNLASSKVPFR